MTTASRDAFIARARQTCMPLAGIDLGLASDDLAGLAAIVGQARIVAIGESWHGTHEILSLKNWCARFLIERLGFNVVIFEGALPGADALDSFVLGGAGDAATLLRGFGQPMWLNPETVELVDWLRAHNAAVFAADKVRACGVDIGYPAAAIFAALAYLDRVDPAWPVPHADVVAAVGRAFQDVRFGSLTKSAVWGSTDVHDGLSASDRAQFHAAFVAIVARLEQHRAQYTARSSRGAFARVLRLAVSVLQSRDVIAVRSRDLTAANQARELALAENVAWVMQQLGPDARAIVLAHNIHVAREPFFSAPAGPPIESMGGHLAAWFGADYVGIGSAVGAGRIRGEPGLSGPRPGDDAARRALIAGSTDAALAEVGTEYFLLPVPDDLDWTTQPRPMHIHFDPQPRYTLARAFDALLYLDRIDRAAPLPQD